MPHETFVLLLLLEEEEKEDIGAREEEGGGDDGVGGTDIVGDAVMLLERDPHPSLLLACLGGSGGTMEF